MLDQQRQGLAAGTGEIAAADVVDALPGIAAAFGMRTPSPVQEPITH